MTVELKYFSLNALGSYAVNAWQNHLKLTADDDPTSGQYLMTGKKDTTGVTSGGLLGDLKDELVTELVFEDGQARVNTSKELAATDTVDNRNGLFDPDTPQPFTLGWEITNSTTAQHSVTNSIKAGISEQLSFGGEYFARSATTISFEYSYSWTDTKSNTKTDTKSFSKTTNVKVPKNKVYKAFVMADRDKASIPYSAQVRLSGVSEAIFPKAVKDPETGESKDRYSADAATICSWIDKYGSAAWTDARGRRVEDEMSFGPEDPDDPKNKRAIASLRGEMKVEQSVNFISYVVDVTSSYVVDPDSKAVIAQLKRGETPEETVLVETIPPDQALRSDG